MNNLDVILSCVRMSNSRKDMLRLLKRFTGCESQTNHEEDYFPEESDSDLEYEYGYGCDSEELVKEDVDTTTLYFPIDENAEMSIDEDDLVRFGDLSFVNPFEGVSAVQMIETLFTVTLETDDYFDEFSELFRKFASKDAECRCAPFTFSGDGTCGGMFTEEGDHIECYGDETCTACKGTRLCEECHGWGDYNKWDQGNFFKFN